MGGHTWIEVMNLAVEFLKKAAAVLTVANTGKFAIVVGIFVVKS